MTTGRRTARGAASLTLALICLLALVLPPAQATFPGRPGLIVFNHIPARDKLGMYVGGLYAMRPGWKNPRQLTDEAWDDEASFAPSGRRLAFNRRSGLESGIFTLDLHNGKTKRLTEGDDRSPAFGPRGMVAFSRRFSQDGSYDLFLRTAAGRIRRLTSTPSDDVDPVFTPDGSKVLFTQDHLRGFPSDEPPPPRKISVIRVDGGGLRDIKGLTDAAWVDISPDGRDLVFQKPKRLANGEAELRIWTRPIAGGRPKLIAEDALIPAYSPSGEKIVYSIFRELWLLDLRGSSEPRQLREWDAAGHLLEDKLTTEPAWQPLPLRR